MNHKDACQKAYENNINVTLHADWEVPEGIQEVVLNSKAKRVGHGSQIINDIEIENEKIKLEPVQLLNHPSNFLFPHEIKPVTKGFRY